MATYISFVSDECRLSVMSEHLKCSLGRTSKSFACRPFHPSLLSMIVPSLGCGPRSAPGGRLNWPRVPWLAPPISVQLNLGVKLDAIRSQYAGMDRAAASSNAGIAEMAFAPRSRQFTKNQSVASSMAATWFHLQIGCLRVICCRNLKCSIRHCLTEALKPIQEG